MKCAWSLDGDCEGEICVRELFCRGKIKGLSIKICEKHFQQHEDVMKLYYKGYNMSDIFGMSAKVRHDLAEQGDKNEESSDASC